MIEPGTLDGLISKDLQIKADIRCDSEAALKEKYDRSIKRSFPLICQSLAV